VCEPVGVSLTHLGPPVRNFRLGALELHHRSERLYVPLLIENSRILLVHAASTVGAQREQYRAVNEEMLDAQ
jgi:hypothetical protein